jgi:glycosyltransferase involved in cell wall biosynthesis
MRVLHVDKFLRRQGGAAGYMLDVAALQRRAGHEVEFFAMQHPANLPATYEGHFPPFVALEPPPSGALARAGTVATMLWSSRAARALAEVVDDFRPDVVHLHNVYHQLSPSILRPLQKRAIPAVMTVHDYKLVCPSYRMLDGDGICEACVGAGPLLTQPIRRRCKDGALGASAVLALESSLHRLIGAWRPVARFIAPSEFLAATLRRGGFATDKVVHLPNFVDASAIEARRGAGEGFVFVGRLSPEKGVDLAVRAIGQVSASRLTVAGEGPERDRLEALAARVAPGQVHFAGHLSSSEVAGLNRTARAALLPARWHENMPLSVLETMAAAVPVVVTPLGGLPELVEDGVDGLVVDADDVDGLAAAVRRLGDDPAAAERLGLAARARMLAQHDAGDHLRHLEQLYRSLGAPRRPGPAGAVR